MIILGLSGALQYDAAAALMINGELVAAAEEERFTRHKHAKEQWPLHAARYCMQQAGIQPRHIDVIAVPFASISLWNSPARWHYAQRHWRSLSQSMQAVFDGNRHVRHAKRSLLALLEKLNIDRHRSRIQPVEYSMSHAASAFYYCGAEDAAILSLHGRGEYATALFAHGQQQRITKLKTIYEPDSLSTLFTAMSEYLGFETLDDEFKLMSMATYGDASQVDLGDLILATDQGFKLNTHYIAPLTRRGHHEHERRYHFTPQLLQRLGPRRHGAQLDAPYTHYAAACQQLLEDTVHRLVDRHLSPILAQHGQLCFAGHTSLNSRLNQSLLARDDVSSLFIQPAVNDSGAALGAVAAVAAQGGESIRPLHSAALGPAFDQTACQAACLEHPERPHYQPLADTVAQAVSLLCQGYPLGWLQGRMEIGPRALGQRSILAHPNDPQALARLNQRIKYREEWRTFCASTTRELAEQFLLTPSLSPFMSLAFAIRPEWQERLQHIALPDGSARIQIIEPQHNPRLHALITAFAKASGYPLLLNTSLNRRGEPIVCSPADALNAACGSGLDYLILGDGLVTTYRTDEDELSDED